MRIVTFFLQFDSCSQDSTGLHGCDFRISVTQTATTMSQHRVMFTQAFYALADIFYRYTHSLSHFFLTFQIVRNKFMQRRIEQTDIHRTTVHCLEDALEVSFLIRQQFIKSFLTSFFVSSQDHFTHGDDLLVVEEHVFCTAQTDTYCTEVTCHLSVMRSISIGTYFQTGIFVTQAHQFGEITGKFGCFGNNFSLVNFTGTAVQRKEVTFFQQYTVNFYGTCLIVYIDSACTGYTAFTHTSCHNCSVRSHTAASCQNTFSYGHTGQVFRRCFNTNQYDTTSVCTPFGSIFCEEDDLTACSTRRSRKTTCQDFG